MREVRMDENRGISSAGRAPALQAGGRRFDPVILHQQASRQAKNKKTRRQEDQTNTKEALQKASLLLVRYRPDQSAVL